MSRRAGSADLPLHGGHVPKWLGDRMTRLGTIITQAIVLEYGRDEMLRRLGVELVPANCPEHFRDDTPTAVMVRQILGAVSQFEKASLVRKLRAARERKRAGTGRWRRSCRRTISTTCW